MSVRCLYWPQSDAEDWAEHGPGATLKPRAMDVDSFGNRILRNGRRPENTKAGPRIAEKYQMLKLENLLVLCPSCPQLLLPGVLWTSVSFANLLGIARTHFGSLTQVFCGPLENWYALSSPCSTELSLHRGQGLGENENCSGRLPSTLEAHFAPQSWQSVSGRWAPQKCKLTVCFYAFRLSLKRACWPNRTTHSNDPKGGTLSFEDEHCTMLKLQR